VRALEFGLRQRPLVWVDESVPNILKSGIVDQVARMWLDEGYAFTVVKFDPKFNGLPQGRRRVFLVAHSVEIPWAPPVFDGHLRTAGEALETAPPRRVPNYKDDPLSPDWIKALHLADEKWGYGANLREAWEELYLETAERHPNGINGRERVKGRPMIMIGRVDPARPSGVVIGVQVYIHPFEDRWLNGREVARLCGYPDDYQWSLEHDDGWTFCEVAKAVTPPAARWLATNLVHGLDARRPAVPTMREVTCWGQGTRLADNRLVFSQRELDDPRLTAVEEGAAS
jgi:site-specific DNA-cytosine methylase